MYKKARFTFNSYLTSRKKLKENEERPKEQNSNKFT